MKTTTGLPRQISLKNGSSVLKPQNADIGPMIGGIEIVMKKLAQMNQLFDHNRYHTLCTICYILYVPYYMYILGDIWQSNRSNRDDYRERILT